jgi:hypothetical protein
MINVTGMRTKERVSEIHHQLQEAKGTEAVNLGDYRLYLAMGKLTAIRYQHPHS